MGEIIHPNSSFCLCLLVQIQGLQSVRLRREILDENLAPMEITVLEKLISGILFFDDRIYKPRKRRGARHVLALSQLARKDC